LSVAWVRETTPKRRIRAVTCALTVVSRMPSAYAIALFDNPSPMRSWICRCLGVSGMGRRTGSVPTRMATLPALDPEFNHYEKKKGVALRR
jgi:hypothetical protein